MLRRFPRPDATPPAPFHGTDANDVDLVARVAGGDLRAFETLYRRYHPRLHRFLALMTPRTAVAEEALNDTLLVVWRRAHTYNGASKVSTWIFAIACRTALKALRRHDEPVEVPLDERASDDPGPEQRMGAGELRAALHRALTGLSAEQRCALVLAYFHELPYAEIARIVDCPVDTVKTRVFHARRRLRALLHDAAGGEAP